jgi:hypothetical protein
MLKWPGAEGGSDGKKDRSLDQNDQSVQQVKVVAGARFIQASTIGLRKFV